MASTAAAEAAAAAAAVVAAPAGLVMPPSGAPVSDAQQQQQQRQLGGVGGSAIIAKAATRFLKADEVLELLLHYDRHGIVKRSTPVQKPACTCLSAVWLLLLLLCLTPNGTPLYACFRTASRHPGCVLQEGHSQLPCRWDCLSNTQQ